jgi:hypothetical protein
MRTSLLTLALGLALAFSAPRQAEALPVAAPTVEAGIVHTVQHSHHARRHHHHQHTTVTIVNIISTIMAIGCTSSLTITGGTTITTASTSTGVIITDGHSRDRQAIAG